VIKLKENSVRENKSRLYREAKTLSEDEKQRLQDYVTKGGVLDDERAKLAEKSHKMYNFFKDVHSILDFSAFKNSLATRIKVADTKIYLKQADAEQWEAIKKKLDDGQVTPKELFHIVDSTGDRSGAISEDEFHRLAIRLGITLSRHRVNEIFAKVKGKAAKSGAGMDLNEKEFEKALRYLQAKNLKQALTLLGINIEKLAVMFVVLVLLLILIFVFIFFGIKGFALGGSFGSVVSSTFPVAGGVGLGKKSESEDHDLHDEKVGDACEKGGSIVKSEKL